VVIGRLGLDSRETKLFAGHRFHPAVQPLLPYYFLNSHKQVGETLFNVFEHVFCNRKIGKMRIADITRGNWQLKRLIMIYQLPLYWAVMAQRKPRLARLTAGS
jgi:hypothetical protein